MVPVGGDVQEIRELFGWLQVLRVLDGVVPSVGCLMMQRNVEHSARSLEARRQPK